MKNSKFTVLKWFAALPFILSPFLNASADPKPTLNIGNDTTICSGSCLTLRSNITGKYKWSTKDTTSSITLCPDNDVTVTLQVTANSKNYSSSIHITVDKYCVWPGDANNNRVVDKHDVLAIGLAYGSKGPSRADTSTSWNKQHADNWKKSFKSGLNYKYADCNGDGKIDSNDIAAIHINWSDVHKKTTSDTISIAGSQLFMVPDKDSVAPGAKLTLHIYLGTSTKPVSNLYGLGFSFQFSPGTVKPGSMQLTVNQSNSWLYGSSDGPASVLSFQQPDYNNNVANVAITRTTLPSSTLKGCGQIGDLSIYLPDNVVGKKDLIGPQKFYFTDEEAIDTSESDIPINTKNSTVYLTSNTSGVKAPSNTINDIDIYPNPVSGNLLNIKMNNATAEIMSISDVLGNVVFSSDRPLSGNAQIQLPNISQGLYFVRLSTAQGIIIRKVYIIH